MWVGSRLARSIKTTRRPPTSRSAASAIDRFNQAPAHRFTPHFDVMRDAAGIDCRFERVGHDAQLPTSREIVAQHRLEDRVRTLRCSGHSGRLRVGSLAPSLNQGREKSQREIRVATFDGLVEPIRQFALA